MSDFSKFKISIENERKVSSGMVQQSNPLSERAENYQNTICDYTQSLPRQQYDKDIAEIVEIVRILNAICKGEFYIVYENEHYKNEEYIVNYEEMKENNKMIIKKHKSKISKN